MSGATLDGEQLVAWLAEVPVPPGIDGWRAKVDEQRSAGLRSSVRGLRVRRLGLALTPVPSLVLVILTLTAALAVAVAAANLATSSPTTPPRTTSAASGPPTASPRQSSTAGTTKSASDAVPVPLDPLMPTATAGPPRRSAPPTPTSSSVPPAWPDASSTGVPPGVSLTPFNGVYTVSTDGTVVSGLAIAGTIEVRANNVTIKNVAATDGGYWVIHLNPGYGGLLVEDSDISGGARRGIYNEGNGMTVLRCNVHGVGNGIALGGNALAQDNYVHDAEITTDSASGSTIRHNTVMAGPSGNGAIGIYCSVGPPTDILVDDNLAAGGGWVFRGGGQCGGTSDIRFTNNHVSRVYYARGGFYGPDTDFNPNDPGNVWSSNVWDGTTTTFGP